MTPRHARSKKIFKKYTKNISWFNDAYKSMKKSNALIILTEWNEFRALDISKVKKLLYRPIIIDFRNIYNPDELFKQGMEYYSVGRPQ